MAPDRDGQEPEACGIDHDTEPDGRAPAETPAPAGGPDLAATTTATGEPRVDAALRMLGELDGLPVTEHPQVFERVHGQLVEVLGELHAGADQPARGG
ncbi:MAG TPA: hypothetical protein VLX31_18320 [Streptosporangiaceae bacterium]|nr:hypothetical protein [Streptosporangiaceae bacterium]